MKAHASNLSHSLNIEKIFAKKFTELGKHIFLFHPNSLASFDFSCRNNKSGNVTPLSETFECRGTLYRYEVSQALDKLEVNYVAGTVCEPVLMILPMQGPLSIHREFHAITQLPDFE